MGFLVGRSYFSNNFYFSPGGRSRLLAKGELTFADKEPERRPLSRLAALDTLLKTFSVLGHRMRTNWVNEAHDTMLLKLEKDS